MNRDLMPLRDKMINAMVYDGWQFIQSAILSIQTAQFCSDLIGEIKKKYEDSFIECQKEIRRKRMEKESRGEGNEIAIGPDDLPKSILEIAGTKYSGHFLINKLSKDFFQYIRNTFDYISQLVNTVLLKNRSLCMEKADFIMIKNELETNTRLKDFKTVRNWFRRVASSPEYIYLDDYCNQTKHISDIYVKLSLSLLDGESKATFKAFTKKGTFHETQDVMPFMEQIWEFVFREFANLIVLLEAEIGKMTPCEGRYHQLLGYQKEPKEFPEKRFAFAYIEAPDNKIGNMPDKIGVLLLRKRSSDSNVDSCNCPLNRIYICNPQNCLEVIGVYNAEQTWSYRQNLYYRQYELHKPQPQESPLIEQIINSSEQHQLRLYPNPYIKYLQVGA